MNSTVNSRPTLHLNSNNQHLKRETEQEHRQSSPKTSNAELVLIRGLPGSGKSTMARGFTAEGYLHFEADMYFEVDGQYQYDASRIRDAHNWCQTSARHALAAGKKVVVSNTFTQLREMDPYFKMTQNMRVIEAKGQWQNVHGVPVEMLNRIASRWEALPASPSRM
jgi:ABC-type molybdenum transport system ATPase subunit/photorepair protein PhrA